MPSVSATALPPSAPALPYRIAVLCFLFDQDDRVLLLHRTKPPNRHLYSPPGGKLETTLGESPAACAQREIREEVGLAIPLSDLHLVGMVSEKAFKNEAHWLMFLYAVRTPVCVPHGQEAPGEGRLEWYSRAQIETLPIPETDREVIWPLFWKHRHDFFAAHIDCSGERMVWHREGM